MTSRHMSVQTTQTIEAAFAELCAKHDLTSITVGMNLKQAEGSRFNCSAHWDGFSRRNITCASGFGPTPTQAIRNALAEVAVDRTQPEPEVPELMIAEAA